MPTLPSQAAFADEPSDGNAYADATVSDPSDPSDPIDPDEVDGIFIVYNEEVANEIASMPAPISLDDGNAGTSELIKQAVENDLEEIGLEPESGALAHDGTVNVVAQPTEGQTIEEAVESAEALPNVAHVEPNYLLEIIDPIESAESDLVPAVVGPDAAPATDDPYAVRDPEQTPNTYWLYQSGLASAWETTKAAGDVTVAVFDTGIDLEHEDLQANILTDLAYDSYNRERLTTEVEQGIVGNGGDADGHGTHVAGIISAAANNGKGIAGGTYNAKLLPVKVTNNGVDEEGNKIKANASISSIVSAYDYLFSLIDSGSVENLRVVNISMGSPSKNLLDSKLHEAIRNARNAGILTVCGGGNSDSFSEGASITDPFYPSDFEECVSVTSVNSDGTDSSWSAYNAAKDISAPGASIWSTYPTETSSYGYYRSLSGSSMASPVAAAGFALIFAAHPKATIEQACAAVYNTADDIDHSADVDGVTGSHGAIRVDRAINSNYFDISFDDVPTNRWFFSEAYQAAAMNIFTGSKTDGLFHPDSNLLRCDAALTVARMADPTEAFGKPPYTEMSIFPDVDPSTPHYYTGAVNWDKTQGIINGRMDIGKFDPSANITRQEFCQIIYNYTKNYLKANVDVSINQTRDAASRPDWNMTANWAKEAMTWAVSRGLVGKAPGGDLYPVKNITRAEAAAIMVRYQKTLEQ